MPREAYGLAPLTRDAAFTMALLLVLSAIAVMADLFTYGVVFFALALVLLAPRLLWALRMRRTALPDLVYRFTVSAEGLGVRWTRPDGTREEKHYEWFMFAQHVVESHRSVLSLRAPSVPGRTRQEVVVLPRALFGERWEDACAIVAAHVKGPPVVTAPVQTPVQRWRPLLLWILMILIFVAVYVMLQR
ncbi:MAG: hypothetical protein U0234_11680 [Sandaracinus sp.]